MKIKPSMLSSWWPGRNNPNLRIIPLDYLALVFSTTWPRSWLRVTLSRFVASPTRIFDPTDKPPFLQPAMYTI